MRASLRRFRRGWRRRGEGSGGLVNKTSDRYSQKIQIKLQPREVF